MYDRYEDIKGFFPDEIGEDVLPFFIDWLVEKGFDKKMGARPLQRVIDKEIKRPLAKLVLFGDLKNGGVLTIAVENDNIVLKPKIHKAKVVENEVLEIV